MIFIIIFQKNIKNISIISINKTFEKIKITKIWVILNIINIIKQNYILINILNYKKTKVNLDHFFINSNS